MESLFQIDNLITLLMLVLLQAVLGFDNLLYITLESRRAPIEKQASVRRLGIGLAIGLRILLLFALVKAVNYFQDPIFSFHLGDMAHGTFNLHAIIVLVGGVFIMYTALKEIVHMLSVDALDQHDTTQQSVTKIVVWIVTMNVIFSFDSILSAMALTDVFIIMAIAIVITGVLMIWLSDHVSEFLEKNRMYEVLGLFILFVVGILLLTEGGHLAHLTLFGNEIVAMSKTTFYFVITVLILSDIVQSRYQKKLMNERRARQAKTA